MLNKTIYMKRDTLEDIQHECSWCGSQEVSVVINMEEGSSLALCEDCHDRFKVKISQVRKEN